ncbi:MAG TPA: LCP family protein [Anaerolineae bacterium]
MRKRFLVALGLVVLSCALAGLVLFFWRPFASSDADTAQFTAPATRFALPNQTPAVTSTSEVKPLLSSTPRPSTTRVSTRTRTPVPLRTPTVAGVRTVPARTFLSPTQTGQTPATEEEILTATAIPAQATVDAMATRSYSDYAYTPGPTPTPHALDSTANILLIGSDQRIGDPHWNTDVMMIVAVDAQAKRIGVLSIPRDLIVPIPQHDANRINETDNIGEVEHFPGGGPALLSFVLKDQFNIRIDRYARVGFQGFDQIIDTLGGIAVNVPCTIEDTIDEKHFVIPAGRVVMDGLTAQQYVRSRNTTNDLSRNARQQRVMYAIAQKLLEIDALSKAPVLWNQLHNVVETDMSFADMLRLGQALLGLDLKAHPERIHARVLEPPAVYDWITAEGAYVFLPNYQVIQSEIDQIFDAPQIGKTTDSECVINESLPTPEPKVP